MIRKSHFKHILHQFGLKVTPARLKVLEILMHSPAALSHSDITRRIDDRNLDKVTLYRTLNAFEKAGLAHKVATEDRNWLYALNLRMDNKAATGHDHAHFICDECDRIYCLPVHPVERQPAKVTKRGFVIRSQEYRLHGTCPECL